jgi:site-specific DNA recombinase
MDKSLKSFESFTTKAETSKRGQNGAVIYTRVSTKEQADNNASLGTQKKYCEMYAKRRNLNIVEYFGGTHESARSDERKEFQRMLDYVKHKPDVTFIIVYSYDRFSRTGSNVSVITEKLKKLGVYIVSATQEVDASTSSGTFQQDLFFLFSKFDNDIRRDKTVGGMKEKLRRGYVTGSVPFGYDNLNPGRGKNPELVVNKDGELLRKAFMLKYKYDWDNVKIMNVLKKEGFRKNHKNLHDYFHNPLYCGIIVSTLIPGEIIEGKHPPIVSKEVFLHINKVLNDRRKKGQRYAKYSDQLPLKGFVKSETDSTNLTGYLVKNRGNRAYYKNNVKGRKENVSALQLHDQFMDLLNTLALTKEEYKEPIKALMVETFMELQQENMNNCADLETQLAKLDGNLSTIERRFALGEIDRDIYTKFKGEFDKEIEAIQEEISKSSFKLSNIEKAVGKAVDYALKLPVLWASGDIEMKKHIQKMIFPEGLGYNFENGKYRTERVNFFFRQIPALTRVLEDKKMKKGTISDAFSSCVGV